MSEINITIDSVLQGVSSSQYFAQKGGYTGGIGFDPDMPATDSDTKLSGFIRPTAMSKFSSTTITAAPLWLVTNPKDANCYCYDSSGKVYSIDSSLNVTALNTGTALTAASGNGANYYDNYLYFAKNTDICRYGPLNGSATFTQNYWTGTLAKTALTNTTYPSIKGIQMPNHVLHRHTDNKLYMCDVTAGNKGILSYIISSKTTVEGDTNTASSYTALDFGFGYYPTSIETYGTDLAVALIEGVQTGVKQKPAAVAFWDTTSSSFTKITQIEFPDPIISAMKNVNGVLYIWSGNVNGGVRLSRFIGGYSFEEVWYSDDGYPPLQGAVDAEMNRLVWGTAHTYPEASVGVFAKGSRAAIFGQGVHNILKTTSAGANGTVTAVKYIQTTANSVRQPIVGWKDDSAQGLDKSATTYSTSVYRSEVFRIGRPFQIKSMMIPVVQSIGANHAATIKVYLDNGSSSSTVATVNNTNYPNGERNIRVQGLGINAQHDFFIEIKTTGSALLTFALPITITIDTTEQYG
jgi:hypothetical protein